MFDIRSSRDDGFRELQLELKPAARSLGLTRDDLVRQVRSAFFGAEALRVLRGREDMRVYVRLPEEERNSVADIDNYVVRTSGGAEIPLGHIASAHFTRSSTAIHTIDGQRVITVTANVDSRVANGQQVNATLESEVLESLAAANPGFSYEFGGEQRQQRQIVSALSGSLIVVFLIMFALLPHVSPRNDETLQFPTGCSPCYRRGSEAARCVLGSTSDQRSGTDGREDSPGSS